MARTSQVVELQAHYCRLCRKEKRKWVIETDNIKLSVQEMKLHLSSQHGKKQKAIRQESDISEYYREVK